MVVTEPQPAPPPRPAAAWHTRLFVLRGDDRAELRERAASLAAAVERQAAAPFAELAASLAAELAPGGVRLAVVAANPADLTAKLRRAADRLADPTCRQLRDAAGVYFTESPLFPQGSLALLYPGEGAQYPNMLADLCGVFPEVEETFAWCDRLAAEAGRPSLRDVLHLPPGATADQKAAAEAELRRLGPSIFGVLVADLAVTRVLRRLALPVAAVAGHSAGELAALLAAGAMRADGDGGTDLVAIMDVMQRQEDEAGGPDVALLAVGAGKATVVEVAAAVSGGAVVVAMDNCPHQCVAVGPTHLVAAVESALVERGAICERLPFRRPYHTPLFEPWMGPFRTHFAGVPFEPPHTPVYSCSTGAKFPADPAAIRELAVNHWVTPVEFTRLVERMYADGVRLFVEAGPRGNLSAFVEDVLRGKPFAAIPANVPRKSEPTQINHLVAQLVVHHVPVDVGQLFAGETGNVQPGRTPSASEGVRRHPLAGARGSPDAALAGYFAVMEQFLDVQREVMTAFLGGHAPAELPALDHCVSPPRTPAPEVPFALVGSVEQFEPGRSVVIRRGMDEREDRYADDHTLGGRGVSRVDPGQNGLPVLPMTFSLEAMAEAAALIVPGKVVVAIRNIRLYRWLPFDPEPTTLEVRAAVAHANPADGTVEITASVRDLGNSFLRDGANKPACEATLVLADAYPAAPEPLPFRLTAEQPCRSTVTDLRRNMFHGPLFQMIRSLDRFGPEGIEGTLEVQPRDGWFRSNPEPRVVLDPVLVDAAMHVLGAWHLEQPDWSGRILLPIGVSAVEFFGPTPAVGSRLVVRGHNEEETARQVRHGLEVFDGHGRPWLRLTGASYWRFYLPFGHVNFFGPKDEYFLSHGWEELTAAGHGRCYFLDPPLDLRQPVLRAAGVRVSMSAREIAEFHTLRGSDQGIGDWFFTRLVAKDAVRAAWGAKHGEAMFPADMETELRDGRLLVTPRGEPKAEPFPPVSVAVADRKVAAFAAFAERVGVGLVVLPKKADAAAERAGREQAARQAVADAMRMPIDHLVVVADRGGGRLTVALTPGTPAPYPDLAGRAVRVQTGCRAGVVIATTVCETDPA